MGLGLDRGLTQVVNTDLVRNVYQFINRLGDEIMAKVPYSGDAVGNTDANGYLVVNHNLGFAPSRVFVQSRETGGGAANAWFMFGVDSITANTFRVRLGTRGTGTNPSYTFGYGAYPATISWMAFR